MRDDWVCSSRQSVGRNHNLTSWRGRSPQCAKVNTKLRPCGRLSYQRNVTGWDCRAEFWATLTVKFTFAPCPIFTEAGAVIVVVDPAKLLVTVCQFVTRFAAFTDPNPVARSYPAVAVHPGLVAADGSTSTPIAFNACVLQSGLFRLPKPFATLKLPTQATELFPTVMSLKVQAVLGAAAEALHAAVPGVVFCAAAIDSP